MIARGGRGVDFGNIVRWSLLIEFLTLFTCKRRWSLAIEICSWNVKGGRSMTPEFDVDGSHRRASSDRKDLLGGGFDNRVVGRGHCYKAG